MHSADRFSSAQWTRLRRPVVCASEDGALELGFLYLSEVRRATLRLVQPRVLSGTPSLALCGIVDLISFGKAETTAGPDGVECRFPIDGGWLVRCPGGSLAVRQGVGAQPELGLVVTDYAPRLAYGTRSWLQRTLYDKVQVRLHVAIGNRFLARMRELAR